VLVALRRYARASPAVPKSLSVSQSWPASPSDLSHLAHRLPLWAFQGPAAFGSDDGLVQVDAASRVGVPLLSVFWYTINDKVPSAAHARPRLVSRMPPLGDEAEISPTRVWTSYILRSPRNLTDASVSEEILSCASTGLGESTSDTRQRRQVGRVKLCTKSMTLAWSDLLPSRALTWLAPLRHHPGHFLRVHLHFLDVHLLPHHWYLVQTIDMVHEVPLHATTRAASLLNDPRQWTQDSGFPISQRFQSLRSKRIVQRPTLLKRRDYRDASCIAHMQQWASSAVTSCSCGSLCRAVISRAEKFSSVQQPAL
jgi:hypothetical protein